MKKYHHTLVASLCIVGVLVVWFIGGTAYRWSCWPFAGMFGHIDDLENAFSPVGTFFSAIAAGATLYLLFWQFKDSHTRTTEFKKQLFENKFFQLIQIHRDNVKNMHYTLDSKIEYKGNNAFFCFYEIFKYSCYNIEPNLFSAINSAIEMPLSVKDATSQTAMGKGYNNTNIVLGVATKIVLSEANNQLSSYYHSVYVLLRYIYENIEDKEERKIYLRIFRSQVSVYEYLMIYYHAAIHDDEHGELRFKKLIEETGFLHNMAKDLIIDKKSLKGDVFLDRYARSAFGSCSM